MFSTRQNDLEDFKTAGFNRSPTPPQGYHAHSLHILGFVRRFQAKDNPANAKGTDFPPDHLVNAASLPRTSK